MELLVFFVALTLLAFAAHFFGEATSDSYDWRDCPGYPGHHHV